MFKNVRFTKNVFTYLNALGDTVQLGLFELELFQCLTRYLAFYTSSVSNNRGLIEVLCLLQNLSPKISTIATHFFTNYLRSQANYTAHINIGSQYTMERMLDHVH